MTPPTVQSDDAEGSTDSLETQTVELLTQLSGKEIKLAPCSSFCFLVHSWWKRACFVFRCLASNGSQPHWSVMFCPFFHGDFRLFWNTFCWQWGHKFSGTEWHSSLRNRVVRRRMCKITGFPLCYPFKWLLRDSSKVHSIPKCDTACRFSTKVVRRADQSMCFANSGFIPLMFSKRRLTPLKRSWVDFLLLVN